MKRWVLVKSNAKKEQIDVLDDRTVRISVKAPPVDGKANEAVIRLLAEYFTVPQNSVRIVLGGASKRKLVEILEK